MTIEEAAQLVIQAASLAKGGSLCDMVNQLKSWILLQKWSSFLGTSYTLSADKRSHGDIKPTGLRPGETLKS